MKKINVKTEVLWNDEVAPSYFKMGFRGHELYQLAVPGQFVMLRAEEGGSPLLRRPFSIYKIHEQDDGSVSAIEILYKVVGKGTNLLSTLKKGTAVSLLGPLGKGFSWETSPKRIFFVGGGVGIPPMVFLAMHLKKKGIDLSQSIGFIGGRSKADILCADDFETVGLPVRISTDDGSMGEKGLVTAIIDSAISEKKPDLICACGPIPMLKAVSGIARTHGVPCLISIETMMACGMGACLGCAVKGKPTDEKYKHVCIDGPVFNTNELEL